MDLQLYLTVCWIVMVAACHRLIPLLCMWSHVTGCLSHRSLFSYVAFKCTQEPCSSSHSSFISVMLSPLFYFSFYFHLCLKSSVQFSFASVQCYDKIHGASSWWRTISIEDCTNGWYSCFLCHWRSIIILGELLNHGQRLWLPTFLALWISFGGTVTLTSFYMGTVSIF